MNIDTVIVRPAQSNEEEIIAQIRAIGFGHDKNKTLAALRSDPRYDLSDVLVAEFGGKVVGTATVFPAKMWLSGVPVKVGAVAGVSVLPEFRRKGIGAKMMRFAILRAYSDRQAMSALFPFSHKYYNKFDYKTVGDLHAYMLHRTNIMATYTGPGQVRPFHPNDLRIIRVMYKGQMTWHNGWFTRTDAWWDKLIKSWSKIVVFDHDGMIEGYIAYDLRTNSKNESVLHIKEMFAPEGPAYQALSSYLATQTEADVIEYLAPPNTLLRHSLRQPVAHNAQNRGWLFNDLCHITPGPVARIIHVPEAFTARFYTRGMSGERVFKITDPLLPANEEPIRFRLVDGRPETQLASDAKIQVETDIGTLTQVLCGYLKAKDANLLGRFKASEDTCSWLDQIIADSPLYIQGGDWF
ncbi:MAG TPA: GNAT family N-acetyltransferase [Anaerolineae bacterium]|nr:GNAT family N-acetyltransferase [Anaerolineae bacterium]MCB0181620.1 GNAT family N-acetyltransferase [Anaerolineae bacterium]MCB0223372.1 GNAT family N-acetyltransferase [Anaerolineae bacterium]MCB9106819.1 GNAT family N-acetyltransferase [Anaerolineales bacterium]HRV91475.1 GNAT family N-acetyltransferase [Anaerolineae bacterium]